MSSLLHRLTSPPAQTLRVLQPTPSTITYTVSTRSVPTTLPAHAAYYVGIVFRVAVGVSSVLLLWMKWKTANGATMLFLQDTLGSEGGHLVRIIEVFQWRYLVPSTLATIVLVLRRNYTGRLSMIFPFLYLRRVANYISRRIPHYTSWSGCSNFNHLLDISPSTHDALPTYNQYPGYLHTRGVQGV